MQRHSSSIFRIFLEPKTISSSEKSISHLQNLISEHQTDRNYHISWLKRDWTSDGATQILTKSSCWLLYLSVCEPLTWLLLLAAESA